jgi:hypothetical protein
MTTTWGVAPVVRMLPPGQQLDGRTTQQWALVIGDGLSNRAVIEGSGEELWRFAVCVGAAVRMNSPMDQAMAGGASA